MFLKNKVNGDLVEILSVGDVIDPNQSTVAGRCHSGEEMQEPESFPKGELVFPSGEALPQCWVDVHYKE